MERYAHITGWGMAVPERVMTNADLAEIVDTSDEWIRARTGIRERRIAGPKETTGSLAIEAAQAAVEVADIDPATIDLIIVATSTPEYVFPSTACGVQDALGAINAGAFDMSAACSGFIYALSTAANAIRSGAHNTVLVIGAETMSRVVNWEDRATCILFGDGAGAFLLQGSEQPGGVLASLLRADGSGGSSLMIPGGGSRTPASIDTVRDHQHCIHMDGKEVYRFATRVMASAVKDVAQMGGLDIEQLQVIVPHQANQRIIDSAARTLGIAEEKFVVNLDRYGNTSAASIPIAVCEAVAQGRIRPNDNLAMVGFGGGLTWGAALVKWDVTEKPETTFWHRARRRASYELAKVRSVVRRGVRQVEGMVYGTGPLRPPPPPEPPPQKKTPVPHENNNHKSQ